MTYYQPTAHSPINQRDLIEHAYTVAGLTVPTSVDALSELLTKEPAVYDLAVEYATKALDSDRDPEKTLDEIVARLTRAHAIESFRDVYNTTIEALALERIDQFRDQAVEDLAAPFAKLVKSLTTAAQKLDEHDPLNQDIAFDQDTTAEWKTVTRTLETLSVYGSIHHTRPINGLTPGAARLASLVHIPETHREKGHYSAGTFNRLDDGTDYTFTMRVRNLVRAADKDIDRTLINIARGKHEGITLALPTTTQFHERQQNLTRALVRGGDRVESDNFVRVG